MTKRLKEWYHQNGKLCPWWCPFKAWRRLKHFFRKESWEKGVGIININSKIGKRTKVWHYVNIFGSSIGEDCIIGSHSEVGYAVIGDRCKIESGVFICKGVTLEDEVFVGPNVVFTNDRIPKVINLDWLITPTLIKKGASIGANSTIRCGVIIGENALIGCGSVVTKDIPAGEVWCGNPARRLR
jgi:acetyltransferase-like isoleucine patch superfamily enzyme